MRVISLTICSTKSLTIKNFSTLKIKLNSVMDVQECDATEAKYLFCCQAKKIKDENL